MLRRFAALMLLGLVWAVAAPAAEIAPDLQSALAAKADGGTVRVLMLFPAAPDLVELGASLADAAPEVRRAAVIDALRSRYERDHARDLSRLAAAGAQGIRSLWLANAAVFEADAAAVAAIAADKTVGGLLHHDQKYDLLADVLACSDSKPAAAALADATPKGNAWSVEFIGAHTVWGMGYTGDGIVVGHIDSGVWLTHPDIANNLWTNPGEIAGNLIDDDLNGYVDDVHGYDMGDDDGNPNDDSAAPGHGTHTAGTVAGDGTGGTVTGVAPDARIMAVKAFDSTGGGTLGMIWEAYQYVLQMGARVITMSLGVPGDLPASLMRAERLNMNLLREAGILMFNSAGNDHFAYSPPIELGLTARCPAPWNPLAGTPYTSTSGVVSVGGTGYLSNQGYSSSSRGPADWGGVDPWNDWPYNPGAGLIKPDVSAPAVSVNSLVPPSGYSGNTWNGTSMACPHAAGLAALMLEKNPSLSPAGMDSILELSSLDLGVVGKDVIYGSGRIDAVAAINLTPTATTPHLSWTDFAILDAGGDGVIDPGESFDLVVTLVNNSPVADGTGVAAVLAVGAGDPVTVGDASGYYGTIAQGGGTADNAGDVFTLTADPGAAQGQSFSLYLSVTAQNGYNKTFDLSWYVGLPEYATHDVGHVLGTVTDMGSLGFMDTNGTQGRGFGPEGANGLYIGSFWGGQSQYYVCNHDFDEGSYDWVVVTTPNGRVKDLGAGISDQDFQAIFDDSGNAAPLDLVVTQESFAFADAPDDDFIILRYTVRNDGAAAVAGYYTGVYCDFDIGDSGANRGATDAARRLTYMYPDGGGGHYGIALLEPTSASNLSLISNPTYVYPDGYIQDSIKARYLRGLLSTPITATADDWSAVTAAGPVTIAAGEEAVFVYALVWGEDLADLQANTDAAQAVDLSGSTAVHGTPDVFGLAQNTPNPFNPQTTIVFTQEREGLVNLAVYDLHGRRVRTLADRVYATGEHRVVWDGRDDAGNALPSGLYLYKMASGERSMTRKMMLVR